MPIRQEQSFTSNFCFSSLTINIVVIFLKNHPYFDWSIIYWLVIEAVALCTPDVLPFFSIITLLYTIYERMTISSVIVFNIVFDILHFYGHVHEGCDWSPARTLHCLCQPGYDTSISNRRPGGYSCKYKLNNIWLLRFHASSWCC